MDRSVAQACRILLLGDEKYGFRCRRVPFILTSFCLAPFGNENGLKCRLKVSCRTLGRRKCTEVLPKRAALHPRATESVGFVAEESLHPYVILPYTHGQQKWTEVSPEHVVPHSRATKMRGSVTQAYRILLLGEEKYGFRCRRVPLILTSFCLAPLGNEKARKFTQACRAALLGDENVRKCCLSVPRYTLGRRIVWVSLPRSPFILTSFCPTPTGNKNGRKCRLKVSYCTLGRRKCSEVSPKRAALHSRATKSVGFVAEESVHPYVILPYTHGQQKWTEVSPERVVPHSRATKKR